MVTGKRVLVGLVLLAALPLAAWAQSTSSIAGTVRDNSGAVMPGVTVEASSPVLIEKVRTAVSDGTGQYRITELPPGTYDVTFTLPGFTAVRREGIQLTSGFTAAINPELAVGSVSETITVSGASPIVDVQNTVQQRVLTREIIDTIPTGKLAADIAILIPGMSVSSLSRPSAQDVGGLVGSTAQALSIHGSRSTDQEPQIEGMSIAVFTANRTAGNTSYITPSSASIQETNIEYAAKSAQMLTAGVRVNTILKSGGNTFSGSGFANFTTKSLQSSNYTAAVEARGVAAPQGIKSTFDGDIGIGGPIKTDRIWFFSSYLNRRNLQYAARYYDTNPNDFVYTPDPAHQVVDTNTQYAIGTKVTWQATPKNKITYYYAFDRTCQCTYRLLADNLAPEAVQYTIYPNSVNQATWTAPVTNRVLLESGFSWVHRPNTRTPSPGAVGPSILDQETGIRFRAGQAYASELADNLVFRASASYVPGAHSVKVGMTYDFRRVSADTAVLADYSIRIVNSRTGVPNQVTFLGYPQVNDQQTPRWGFFGQDQWSVNRFTINAGARVDIMGGQYPDLKIQANRYFKETAFPATSGLLSLKNVNPRFGIVYDVFGNAKTALKASLGRFNLNVGPGVAQSPLNFVGLTLARTWNDSAVCAGCISGDYVPQGDPLNPAANGELSASPNNNFGTPNFTTQYLDSWAHGWQTLDYNWEASLGLSHQLMPGVGLDVAYFRRIYGNFSTTDNTLVSPSDYDSFCITAPTDTRLPNGGGQRICGLDLKPAAVGKVANVVGNASDFGGKQYEHWNGFDISFNIRPRQGILFQGGTSTGKTMTDNCDIAAKVPESVLGVSAAAPNVPYCHGETPFQTQVKFLSSFRLPWAVDLAASYQGTPGVPLTANWSASNALIAPVLGRNLSAGATANVSLNLIAPGTAYEKRLNQVDFRVARAFAFQGGRRIKANFDLFNALNANPVTVYNTAYGATGASWTPLQILPGRLIKFEAQVTF